MMADLPPGSEPPHGLASATDHNPASAPPGEAAPTLDYRAAGHGPDEGRAAMRQSGRGWASLMIGLLVILGFPCVILLVASSWTRSNTSPYVWLFYGSLVVVPSLSLIGVGLSIACLYERQRKKAIAIIGLIINAGVVIIALLILLFVLIRW